MEKGVDEKERYRLLIEGGIEDDKFLEAVKGKVKDCGCDIIGQVSRSEIMVEGENGPITELIKWLLAGTRLKKLRYLKPELEKKP